MRGRPGLLPLLLGFAAVAIAALVMLRRGRFAAPTIIDGPDISITDSSSPEQLQAAGYSTDVAAGITAYATALVND